MGSGNGAKGLSAAGWLGMFEAGRFMKDRFLLFGLALLPTLSLAHNTNVTHPRITERAVLAIKELDTENRYTELYRNDGEGSDIEYRRINWGEDPFLSETESLNDAEEEFAAFRKVRRNVLDGVVMEDNPLSVVLRHFYHPYSGDPLTANGVDVSDWASHLSKWISGIGRVPEIATSKTAGIRFFDQAVELSGYDTLGANAYGTAFWFFGHSLHHLEDMNSIAHVQGDVHLTHGYVDALPNLVFEERDDFEANYIPTMLWDTSHDPSIAMSFEQTSAIPVADFEQIWPSPVPTTTILETGSSGSLAVGSLARSTYNFAAFQGALELPLRFEPDNECGEGELAEMLNDPLETDCRLHWGVPWYSGYPHWLIDGVGEYDYQDLVEDPVDGWWGLTEFNGPDGYYYIEQLMRGIGQGTGGADDPFDASNLVVPYGRRQDFSRAWDPDTNPVVENADEESLMRLIAHQVLPLGVQYAAGYAQWWYQIANTPPFLKKVEVYQHGPEAGPDGDLKYFAEWENAIAQRDVYLLNETGLDGHTPVAVRYVRARSLKRHIEKLDSFYLTEEGEIELYLEFNEPIKDPRESESGFEIKIGNQSITPASIESADDDMSYPDDPWFQGRRWKLVLPQSALNGLNGKIPLTVKAMDKALHWDGPGNELKDGLGLDEEPSTPARRQRRDPEAPAENFAESGAASEGWLDYPWHDSESYDINFQVNVANPDHRMKAGDFAYDNSGDGDQTHYLIFDNEKPQSKAIEGAVQDPPDA